MFIFKVYLFHSRCRVGLQGRIQRGAHPARAPPLKLEKIWFFWGKIVIFHTKYTNNFRASLRSARFFLSAPPPPNLKSWIRPGLGLLDI